MDLQKEINQVLTELKQVHYDDCVVDMSFPTIHGNIPGPNQMCIFC